MDGFGATGWKMKHNTGKRRGCENGEDCRTGSFTVCTEHMILIGWSEVTHEIKNKNTYKVSVGNPEGGAREYMIINADRIVTATAQSIEQFPVPGTSNAFTCLLSKGSVLSCSFLPNGNDEHFHRLQNGRAGSTQHQGQEYVEAYLHSTHVPNVWGLIKHRENLTFALIRRHICNSHNSSMFSPSQSDRKLNNGTAAARVRSDS